MCAGRDVVYWIVDGKTHHLFARDEIENKARRAAKAKGKSVSRWMADQVVESIEGAWPKGVLDAAGAFRDFPSLEEIRKGYGADASRDH